MSRLIDAFEQFFDANGQPLSDGYLRFYENETTTFQDTYEDEAQTIPNLNPMPLTGDGRVNGNVYASLVYTVQLLDVNLNVIESYDNVEPRGGISTGSTILNWDSTTNYIANNSIVLAGDGNYYVAIQANMNQNPVSDTNFEYWKRVKFDEWYSQFLTYSLNDIVIASDGQQYISLVGSNINNNPVGNGGVQWELYATNEWSTGKSYLAGDIRIADNGRWYKAVIDNSGNNPSADDGTNWLPSTGKVDKPSNLSPTDGEINVIRTPTVTSSPFSVTGGSDSQEWARWQIASDAGFTSVIRSSDITSDNLESYQFTEALPAAATLYFRKMDKGEFAGMSEWSDGTSFTTVPALSEVFSINSDTGNGTSLFVSTGVDLFTQSGSVWVYNRDAASLMKKMDTVRGLLELDCDVNTPEAVNANGVQAYTSTGFTVGSDAAYNGNTNTISSFTFQNKEGFHDVIQYTGNNLARTLSHNLGIQAGAVIGKAKTASVDPNDDYFRFGHKDSASTGTSPGAPNSTGDIYGGMTSTFISLGSEDFMNGTGTEYIIQVFAHNPAQGIYCGSYIGTGVSGNKITTGFPCGMLITWNSGSVYIADVVTGVSSHIEIEGSANTEKPGSVSSFDVDGVTLDGNDLNSLGSTYYFIMIADPDNF